jgi:phosphoglycolate phosphatase-like HAD superfamily hydrolase
VIRLVLFDIDGTLIRTGGAGEKAFARVSASEFNIPNGTARLSFSGRTDTGIVRDFFSHNQIEPSPDNFRRFFDSYVFWLDHLLKQAHGRVLPGIHRALRDLEDLPQPPLVGLLTGNIRLGAQIKLTHYELWHCFRTGAFGDDHEDRCQIAAIACQRGSRLLGETLRGQQVLVIGDTPLDIACARSIEAKVLAVSTGSYSLEELKSHQPTWTVKNLEGAQMRDFCLER